MMNFNTYLSGCCAFMSFKDSLIGLMIILIWGFNFVVIAWGVNDMPPLLLGTLRFIGLAIIGFLFIKRPAIPWYWLAAYAFILCFGQFAFLFSALAVGMPAGLASVVLQSQAVFTIIFSVFLLKEVIKKRQVLAILLAGMGLLFIVSDSQSNIDVTQVPTIGFILTLIAAVMWALGNVVNRMINQRGYRADIGLVAWSAWFAIIPFMFASLFIEGIPSIVSALENLHWKTIGVLAYLVCAASLIGYGGWSYLLSKYEVGQVVPLTLGVPVVGIVSAVIFLGESMSIAQYTGSALVMLGLCLNMLGKPIMVFLKKHFNRMAIKAS